MTPLEIYMRINNQPGSVLAIFVFGPILLYKGLVTYKYDVFLIVFAILLILWDLWWFCYAKPKGMEFEME